MSANNSINGDFTRLGPDFRRYMFAVELKAGSRTEYQWDPACALKKPMDPADNEAVRQTLVIRRAIVGPTAKEGESNLISVEIDDMETEPVTFPMVYLVQGKEPQSMVDLTFPEHDYAKIKFTLSQGTGPVHLVGYHLIERISTDDPDFIAEEEDEECEEDEDEGAEELEEDKENKVKAQPIAIRLTTAAKRRLPNGHEEIHAKKLKVVAEPEAKIEKENKAKDGAEDEAMDNETSEPQPEPKKEVEAAEK